MTGARRGDTELLGSDEERAPLLQWLGLLLAPAAFFAHLQVAYVLVPWSCVVRGQLWVHVAGAAAIALAAVGTWAAWRTHVLAESEQPTDGAGAVPRTRFLGDVGLCTSAMFVLLLVAQWAAGFIISPCQ